MGEFLNEESFDLSIISEVINNYSAVAAYMNIDVNLDKPFENVDIAKLEDVSKWLYQITENGSTRIGDNRNLRLLNKVLQNEEAKKAFIDEKKSIKESAELTDLSDDNIRFYLNQANANMLESQKLVHKAKMPTKKDEDLVEEISSSAALIAAHFKMTIRANKVNSLINENNN